MSTSSSTCSSAFSGKRGTGGVAVLLLHMLSVCIRVCVCTTEEREETRSLAVCCVAPAAAW